MNVREVISEAQGKSLIKIRVFADLKLSKINREFQLKWGLQYFNYIQTKVCLGSILTKMLLNVDFNVLRSKCKPLSEGDNGSFPVRKIGNWLISAAAPYKANFDRRLLATLQFKIPPSE